MPSASAVFQAGVLAIYVAASYALTAHSKAVLGAACAPCMLTALHMAVTAVVAWLCLGFGWFWRQCIDSPRVHQADTGTANVKIGDSSAGQPKDGDKFGGSRNVGTAQAESVGNSGKLGSTEFQAATPLDHRCKDFSASTLSVDSFIYACFDDRLAGHTDKADFAKQASDALGDSSQAGVQSRIHPREDRSDQQREDKETGKARPSNDDSTPQKLTTANRLYVGGALGALMAVNVAASNATLALVPLWTHQALRSLGPLATACVGLLFLAERPPARCWGALCGVAGGVVLVFVPVGARRVPDAVPPAGVVWTLLGVLLASAKGVLSVRVVRGRGMGPVRTAAYSAPIAALCAAGMSLCFREDLSGLFSTKLTLLLVNAGLAAGVNAASFCGATVLSAVAMAVAANAKTAAAVVLSRPCSVPTWLGCAVTLAGAVYYSLIRRP